MTPAELSFARPVLLWAGLIFPVILILFLIQRRRKIVNVPNLYLWRRVAMDGRNRKALHWLKLILDLFLWLLIVACGVVAAAQPTVREKYQPQALALVLDNSASMTAGIPDTGYSRFRQARLELVERLQRMKPLDRAAVFSSCPHPRKINVHRRDGSLDLTELMALDCAWTDNQIPETLDLARSWLNSFSGSHEKNLFLLSDASDAGFHALGDATLILHSSDSNNLGWTHFQVERDPFLKYYALTAVLKNFGGAKTEVNIRMELEGAVFDSRDALLDPGQSFSLSARIEPPLGGELVLSLASAKGGLWRDALSDDDVLRAKIPNWRKPKVYLVTPDEQTASLLSGLLVSLQSWIDLENSRSVKLSKWPEIQSLPEAEDFVIFEHCAPEQKPGKGQAVFIGSKGQALPFECGQGAALGRIKSPNPNHALLRFVDFGKLQAKEILPLVAPKNAEILLESESQPFIVSGTDGELRYVYIGLNLENSNFAFLDGFPIFFGNLFLQNAGRWKSLFRPCYGLKDPIETRLPTSGKPELKIKIADKKIQILPVEQDGNIWRFGPAFAPGKCVVTMSGETLSPTYVNFLNEGESSLKALGDSRLKSIPLPIPYVPNKWAGRPYGPYAALLMLVLLLAEWSLFQFKWIKG